MGVDIHLQPKNAWEFYQKNKKRLASEMVVIAENKDTGYFVCMTEEIIASKGVPYFNVYREEEKVYAEGTISEKDCVKTLRDIYLKYLFPIVEVSGGKKEIKEKKIDDFGQEYDSFIEEKEQEIEDTIYQREDALFHAMSDFLQVLLCCDDHDELVKEYSAEMISEAVEDFCNYMADIHLISVYHPRWEKNDETGEDYLEEYPHLMVEDVSEDVEDDSEDKYNTNKPPKRMLG